MSEAADMERTERSAAELARVQRSVWIYMALMALVELLIGAAFFRGSRLLGYYATTLPWTLLVGILLAANVHLLYTPEGRALRSLNLATRVTLIRVLAVPLIFHLIFQERLLAAGIVFLVAALTDWLDGFLARRMNEVTQLGRMVDPSIDASICFLTFAALYLDGRLPHWLIVLVLLRYGILAVGALGLKAALGRLPVRATFLGRLFYFIQYGMIILYLLSEARLPRALFLDSLAFVQVAVSIQLLTLGLSLYRENQA